MKLRAVMEADVPDDIGELLLAEQKNIEIGVSQPVRLDRPDGRWTYYVEAPYVWERVDGG